MRVRHIVIEYRLEYFFILLKCHRNRLFFTFWGAAETFLAVPQTHLVKTDQLQKVIGSKI